MNNIIHCHERQIPGFERGLAIKPIQQHLSVRGALFLDTLGIYCSSRNSMVSFEDGSSFIKALSIHCCSSCGGSSCLQIVGLRDLVDLEQVLVMGPCSYSFEKDLRRQFKKHEGKPVLSFYNL